MHQKQELTRESILKACRNQPERKSIGERLARYVCESANPPEYDLGPPLIP